MRHIPLTSDYWQPTGRLKTIGTEAFSLIGIPEAFPLMGIDVALKGKGITGNVYFEGSTTVSFDVTIV